MRFSGVEKLKVAGVQNGYQVCIMSQSRHKSDKIYAKNNSQLEL